MKSNSEVHFSNLVVRFKGHLCAAVKTGLSRKPILVRARKGEQIFRALVPVGNEDTGELRSVTAERMARIECARAIKRTDALRRKLNGPHLLRGVPSLERLLQDPTPSRRGKRWKIFMQFRALLPTTKTTAKRKTPMSAKAKNDAITITAVRNLRKSIRVEWKEGADDVARNFHDNPLPSFYKALEALKPHVCSLCEFEARDAKKIVPTGITVRYSGDDQSQALIVARKTIRKGKRVFNIATPLLSMYESKDNETLDHMDEDQARAVEKVISEATKYLCGERAQGQIQFEEEEPASTKGDDGDKTEKFPGMDKPEET